MQGIVRIISFAALLAVASLSAQTIYKSVNPDGTVVYSDKPPADGKPASVVPQKPAAEPPAAVDASGNPPAVRVDGNGQSIVTIGEGARDDAVQRAAYGPGVPRAPVVSTRVAGPVQVEVAPDGTRTFSSQGRAFLVERRAARAPVWDDHVSPVASVCDKPTGDYDPQPDQTFLQAALRAGRFAELEHRLEVLYQPVRAAHCSDRPIYYAFQAFDDSAQDLEMRYAQWLAASPRSPWPYVARASFILQRAMAARGSKVAQDTAPERFAAMRSLLEKAIDDLRAAQLIEPDLSLAAGKQVTIARYYSSPEETRQVFERYREQLPRSYAVVMAYTPNLQARWGGNAQELAQFVEAIAAHADLNPDFALLPSYGMCLFAGELRDAGRGEDAARVKERGALQYAGRLETRCYSKELIARAERNRQLAETQAGPVDASAGRLPEPKHKETAAEGRALLDRLLVTEHGNAGLYCRRAVYSYRENRYEEARDFVAQGIALDAHEPACVRERARLSRLSKPLMPAPSLDELAVASKDASRDGILHFEYGLALIAAQRLDAADAQFTQAIALDELFDGAWYRRGWVRARTGQLTLALADFDKAIEITPKAAVYLAERGRAHLLLDQYDAAAQDLAQAERLDARDVTTQTYLAALYEARKDCRRVDAYRKVAALCGTRHCDAEQAGVAAKFALPELRQACAGEFTQAQAGAM
jgi:tetratricopeptide (TPR) repeat protein